MGPLTHIWRMRVLLQLILPLLVQGKSIVKERNGVIKQALIPTLVNIIGHARMQEHGIGDDMDGLLNFMDEEKILDPFLSWLAWFTNLVVDKEEGKSEEEAEESRSIVKERNDVIKQALTPTLVNIVRHARMQEHGTDIDNLLNYMDEEKILDPFLQWLGWFTDTILEGEEQGEDQAQEEKDDESDDVTESDEKVLELEVLEKEESMEETIKNMEEEEDHEAIPQEDDEKTFEEEIMEKERSLEENLKEEISDKEASGTGQENYDEEASGNGQEEEIYVDEASETRQEEDIYDDKASETGQETKREILEKEGSEESGEEMNYYDEASETGQEMKEEIYDDEASETGWPGDPKGYNGPKISEEDEMPDGLMDDVVPQRWA